MAESVVAAQIQAAPLLRIDGLQSVGSGAYSGNGDLGRSRSSCSTLRFRSPDGCAASPGSPIRVSMRTGHLQKREPHRYAGNRVHEDTRPAHDRPVTVISPTGVATAYVYDGFGDLIQESNPNTGATVYNYDSTGNRIKCVTATGATTQYTYDALDRVVTKTFPSDSAENVAYTYDQSGHGAGIGRLTSVSDAAGTLSRSYDQLGNLLSDARTTSVASLTMAYSYDAANRIASITYPSGAAVSYTRDTMGRITAVAAQPNGGTSTPVVSNVAYEPFGPYNGLTNGNGIAEARGFDQDYRMTGIAATTYQTQRECDLVCLAQI